MATIKVNAAEFLKAVSGVPRMKRGPLGARGSIPKDTTISPAESDGILVDTPAFKTLVRTDGRWSQIISIDARLLHEKTKRLLSPKSGIPNVGVLELSVSDGVFRMKGLSEVALPLFKPAARPVR